MSKYSKHGNTNSNYRGGICNFTTEDDLLTLNKINFSRFKERFLSHVRKTNNCWYWTASVFSCNGRARAILGTRSVIAARVSYVLFKGKISSNLVCHTCDNILCVNPKHLFLGTHKDNAQDMIQKGRKFLTYGTTNGRAKLKDKEVIAIRSLAKHGVSNSSLAKQFNVSYSNICLITSGKSWQHLLDK